MPGPTKQAVTRLQWVRSWPNGRTAHIKPNGWRSVLCKSGNRNGWVALGADPENACPRCRRELEART